MRNVHQAFGYGLFAGPGVRRTRRSLTRMVPDDLHGHAGHERMKTLAWYYGIARRRPDRAAATPTAIDRKLTFDKVTNVHFSGTCTRRGSAGASARAHGGLQHDLRARVWPSVHRASVPRTSTRSSHDADGTPRLQINASNCVHCKTCDIMDPVPGDHLGAARRWRRAAIQWHVACRSDSGPNWGARSGVSEGKLRTGARLATARGDCRHRRARLSADQRARPHAALAGRGLCTISTRSSRPAGSRSWRSGTAASFRPPSTSAAAASSSSPARTSTASGSRASSSGLAIGTARGSSSRGGLQAMLQLVRDMEQGSPRRSRSTGRAVRRASRSRARSGWPARPAIRCCRFTSRRRRTGRRTAGTARRFRSRSATVALAIGEPLDVPADATDEQLECRSASSSKRATRGCSRNRARRHGRRERPD